MRKAAVNTYEKQSDGSYLRTGVAYVSPREVRYVDKGTVARVEPPSFGPLMVTVGLLCDGLVTDAEGRTAIMHAAEREGIDLTPHRTVY